MFAGLKNWGGKGVSVSVGTAVLEGKAVYVFMIVGVRALLVLVMGRVAKFVRLFGVTVKSFTGSGWQADTTMIHRKNIKFFIWPRKLSRSLH